MCQHTYTGCYNLYYFYSKIENVFVFLVYFEKASEPIEYILKWTLFSTRMQWNLKKTFVVINDKLNVKEVSVTYWNGTVVKELFIYCVLTKQKSSVIISKSETKDLTLKNKTNEWLDLSILLFYLKWINLRGETIEKGNSRNRHKNLFLL